MNLFVQLSEAGNSIARLDFGFQTNIKLKKVIIGDVTVNDMEFERALTLEFEKVNDSGKTIGVHSQGVYHLDIERTYGVSNMYSMLCDIADAFYYEQGIFGEDKISEFFEKLAPAGFDPNSMKTQEDLEKFELLVGQTLQAMIEENKDKNVLFKMKLTATKKGRPTLSNDAESILNMKDGKELPKMTATDLKNSEAQNTQEPSNDNTDDVVVPETPMDGFPDMGGVDQPVDAAVVVDDNSGDDIMGGIDLM